MHVIAGTEKAFRVARVLLDGKKAREVYEANEEEGWLIRYATDAEVRRLVHGPGLVWPEGEPVLIQERGEVTLEMRSRE